MDSGFHNAMAKMTEDNITGNKVQQEICAKPL